MNIRKERKDDHLEIGSRQYKKVNNGFEKYHLVNNSLPGMDYCDIDTSCYFLNRKISYPILINAITGGTEYGYRINRALAELSKEYDIPMAVGSQKIGLQIKYSRKSFEVVRNVNKDGIIIGNLSANAKIEEAKEVIDMIGANALQLHLNVPQEICMKEGERCFIGILDNIEKIKNAIDVPVIVKEVGFGVSAQCFEKIVDKNINYVDIGGYGGTNFVKIENARREDGDKYKFLEEWGIPTAVSLVECRKRNRDTNIICTGGMYNGEEIVKSIRLGANIVGISGPFIQSLGHDHKKRAHQYLEDLVEQLKIVMLLVGAKNINEIKNIPLYAQNDIWQEKNI